MRRDFLAYHRRLRDCARRLDDAWLGLGERNALLSRYFRDLERGSHWRDDVVTPPRDCLEACLVDLEEHLERGDLHELCRVSRRIRYVAERLENCNAHDRHLLEKTRELLRRSIGTAPSRGDRSDAESLRLEKYRRNIAKRLAILERMLLR